MDAPFSVEYRKTSASFKRLSILNTPVLLLDAPFSTEYVVQAKSNRPSFLFVAPFSTDSTFNNCDLNLDMRFVLILNYKHVRTAGLRVCELGLCAWAYPEERCQ